MEYEKDAITVILTFWKRDNFELQVDHILRQSMKPKQIWAYQNESHIDLSSKPIDTQGIPLSFVHSKDLNFKFHGRFTLPLLCDTEYTAIFDDDSIPGSRWFENCLRLIKERNCIVGANGRKIKKDFMSIQSGHWQEGIGGPDFTDADTRVDFVGHAWFFKSDWTRNIWKDRPFSWDSGEDIHFSAACKIYENVDSYVPYMPADDLSLNGDSMWRLGNDIHAAWRNSNHQHIRKQIVSYWISKGWRTMFHEGLESSK